MTKYRWILSLSGWMPQQYTIERAASLAEARDLFEMTCRETFDYGWSAWLYPYSDEDWELAEEFRHVGNPFDYPTYVMGWGPRGGVRTERAC